MSLLWLAAGEDDMDTTRRGSRPLDITVTCEDGMMPQIQDPDSLAEEGDMLSMATVSIA